MWDVNTCVMPTLVVCDMAKKLFCDGAGLEAEKLVCDSLLVAGGRLAIRER